MIWQPIETAPRDGTDVLLWCPRGGVTVGRWDEQEYHRRPVPYWRTQHWFERVSMDRSDQPTHWATLPTAPAPEKGESR